MSTCPFCGITLTLEPKWTPESYRHPRTMAPTGERNCIAEGLIGTLELWNRRAPVERAEEGVETQREPGRAGVRSATVVGRERLADGRTQEDAASLVSAQPPPVEDSHAKIAADCRAHAESLGYDTPEQRSYLAVAARIEQLGRIEEKKAAVIEAARGKAAQMESYTQHTGNPVTGQDGLLLAAVRALVEAEESAT